MATSATCGSRTSKQGIGPGGQAIAQNLTSVRDRLNSLQTAREIDFLKIFAARKSTRVRWAYWKQAGQRRIPRAAIIAATGLQ
jgi:hypothetical protein